MNNYLLLGHPMEESEDAPVGNIALSIYSEVRRQAPGTDIGVINASDRETYYLL